MTNKKRTQFKMQIDNHEPDALFAEERNDLKFEKLAQKVTIISILIPVLIGAILVISYLDIKTRVSSFKDTGESEVQSLSKNLESRFSSLSVKFASLEETFTDNIKKAAKTQRSLQARLKEAEKSVRWLSKIKAAKKTFDQKTAGIEENLTAIRTDLQTLDSNLTSLDQSAKKELTDLITLVENSENMIMGLQSRFAQKINREEALQAVSEQKIEILASLEAMGLRLEKQIVLNRQRIAAVKEKVGQKKPVSTTKPAPGQTTKPEPAPKQTAKPEPAKPEPPFRPEPVPKPGEIVEQDL